MADTRCTQYETPPTHLRGGKGGLDSHCLYETAVNGCCRCCSMCSMFLSPQRGLHFVSVLRSLFCGPIERQFQLRHVFRGSTAKYNLAAPGEPFPTLLRHDILALNCGERIQATNSYQGVNPTAVRGVAKGPRASPTALHMLQSTRTHDKGQDTQQHMVPL